MDITKSRPGTNLRDSVRDFVHPSPVSDSRLIPANEIVVGCVTEDTPKYLGQTLRLVQSIRWFGGALARPHLVVGSAPLNHHRPRPPPLTLRPPTRPVPRLVRRHH